MSESAMPEKEVTVDWNRVMHVFFDGATSRAEASREPTCLERIIAGTLANAVAVANAPFCRGGDDERELAEVDLRKVVALVAEQTVAGMLDDAILVLREVLLHCIGRGDSSVYAVDADEGNHEPKRLSLGYTTPRG